MWVQYCPVNLEIVTSLLITRSLILSTSIRNVLLAMMALSLQQWEIPVNRKKKKTLNKTKTCYWPYNLSIMLRCKENHNMYTRQYLFLNKPMKIRDATILHSYLKGPPVVCSCTTYSLHFMYIQFRYTCNKIYIHKHTSFDSEIKKWP